MAGMPNGNGHGNGTHGQVVDRSNVDLDYHSVMRAIQSIAALEAAEQIFPYHSALKVFGEEIGAMPDRIMKGVAQYLSEEIPSTFERLFPEAITTYVNSGKFRKVLGEYAVESIVPHIRGIVAESVEPLMKKAGEFDTGLKQLRALERSLGNIRSEVAREVATIIGPFDVKQWQETLGALRMGIEAAVGRLQSVERKLEEERAARTRLQGMYENLEDHLAAMRMRTQPLAASAR